MPSRSSEGFAEALARAVEQISDTVARRADGRSVVLIDGRAGAGKTTIARELAAAWPLAVPVQLVALDSIYPGWHGLAAGVELARSGILAPHRAGDVGTWRRWDWKEGAPAEQHTVLPGRGLILEGCGALTPDTAVLADVRVWIEAPDDARKRRALARDGEMFRPHWDAWAAQEEAHIAGDDPRGLADLIIQAA